MDMCCLVASELYVIAVGICIAVAIISEIKLTMAYYSFATIQDESISLVLLSSKQLNLVNGKTTIMARHFTQHVTLSW